MTISHSEIPALNSSQGYDLSQKIIAPTPNEYNGFIVEFNFENKKCGYTPNTLNHNISLQIDGRLIETNGVVDRNIYSVKDYVNHVYIRNPNHWLTSIRNEKLGITEVDLTAISPWNSTVPIGTDQDQFGYFNTGTAITPRHIITAAHYVSGEGSSGQVYPGTDVKLTGFTVGDTIKFVTNNNEVITRTIVGKINNEARYEYLKLDPNWKGPYEEVDIEIAVLDEDLPPSIKPVKLIDKNVLFDYIHGSSHSRSNYNIYLAPPGPLSESDKVFPNISVYNNNSFLPCFWVDQKEESIISQVNEFWHTTGNPDVFEYPMRQIEFTHWEPGHPYISTVNNLRKGYGKPAIRGDSSSPVFFIINNELVLLTTWTYYNAGYDYSYYKNTINRYIEELGGDHVVSYFDFSQFIKNGVEARPSVFNSGIDLKLAKQIEGGNNHLLVMRDTFLGRSRRPISESNDPVRHYGSVMDPSLKRIVGFGNNSKGQLNFPDIPETRNQYASMSAGKYHTAITYNDNKIDVYGQIFTNSGSCTGITVYTPATAVYGSYGTKIVSGENHIVALEDGANVKYSGTIVKLDSVLNRIYVKGIQTPKPLYINDPAGTKVIITNPSGSEIKRSIQHQLRSIVSYENSPQVKPVQTDEIVLEQDRTAIE
jgi:hypothetical protein